MKLSGEEDGDGPGEREREERVESKYIVRKKLKQCKIKLFIPKKKIYHRSMLTKKHSTGIKTCS